MSTPEKSPVRPGDRLLLDPSYTSLEFPAWATVEIVERADEPLAHPWNAGPNFPYRVGFAVDPVTVHLKGTVWLDESSRDASNVIREIVRATMPGPID